MEVVDKLLDLGWEREMAGSGQDWEQEAEGSLSLLEGRCPQAE